MLALLLSLCASRTHQVAHHTERIHGDGRRNNPLILSALFAWISSRLSTLVRWRAPKRPSWARGAGVFFPLVESIKVAKGGPIKLEFKGRRCSDRIKLNSPCPSTGASKLRLYYDIYLCSVYYFLLHVVLKSNIGNMQDSLSLLVTFKYKNNEELMDERRNRNMRN